MDFFTINLNKCPLSIRHRLSYSHHQFFTPHTFAPSKNGKMYKKRQKREEAMLSFFQMVRN